MLGLNDLDELVLTVRDKTSKLYINEAILSYRVGAYRAAIVSNWIAVTFDIISKIRELSEQGDAEAKKDIENLNKYISHNQIAKVQDFENELLSKAEKGYGFITVTESRDLLRLKEDRNNCAHPAISDNGLLYQPTAELVKTHIVHSILFLLQQRPVQGKVALNSIKADLKKLTFPTDFENTRIWLNSKYLDRAKPALMKNLIQALVTGLLNGEIAKDGKTTQVLNTLKVVETHDPLFYAQELNDILRKKGESLDDEQLWFLLDLLTTDKSIWSRISISTQIRIIKLLNSIGTGIDEVLKRYTLVLELNIDDLKSIKDEILLTVASEIDKKIDVYANVTSYASAKSVGEKEILPYIPYFNLQNTLNVLNAITANRYDQILNAVGSEGIIEAIFDGTQKFIEETLSAWQKVLDKIDDESYVRLRVKIKSLSDGIQ